MCLVGSLKCRAHHTLFCKICTWTRDNIHDPKQNQTALFRGTVHKSPGEKWIIPEHLRKINLQKLLGHLSSLISLRLDHWRQDAAQLILIRSKLGAFSNNLEPPSGCNPQDFHVAASPDKATLSLSISFLSIGTFWDSWESLQVHWSSLAAHTVRKNKPNIRRKKWQLDIAEELEMELRAYAWSILPALTRFTHR